MTLEKQTSLLKSCKNCNKEIVLERKNSTRGSTNLFRRVFCTDKCKNEFGRRKTENKIEKNCEVCTKIFYLYPSQLDSRFCSYNCKSISQKKEKITLTNTCKNCDNVFETTNRSINEYYCSRKCFYEHGVIEKICITCNNLFKCKKSRQRERCSRKCQFIDQSNGKIKIHLNGRSGYRLDLGFKYYFKSALEADFVRVMKHESIMFEYEPCTFIFENKRYTPDFYLPYYQTFIELKGVDLIDKQYNNLMTKNISCHKELKNNNVKIITVTQKQFYEVLIELNLWYSMPVLEIRNYKKNRELVMTYDEYKKNISQNI